MIGNKKNICLLISLIFLLFTGNIAYTAETSLSSEVSSTRISMGESLILTLTVTGSDKKPELGPMPDFTIAGTSTMTSIQIINFKSSSSVTYTYILIPKKTGTFFVGASEINTDKGKFRSSAHKVEVLPRTGNIQTDRNEPVAGNNSNIFIKSYIDKKEVYVGEQITLTFELYNRLPLADTPQYEPPATTGFWIVQLPHDDPQGQIKNYNGKRYYYYEIKTALFPTGSGNMVIGPASLSYISQGGFFSTGVAETLKSDPIPVTVKPLPTEGQPADFYGAVGKFEITANPDKTELKAGDVVTITVALTGTGNLDLITKFTQPEFRGFKTYDPKVMETISNSGFRVGGAKSWEFVIIPEAPGNYTLKPFSLVYFDVSDKKYHTAMSDSILLKVSPGASVSSSSGIRDSGTGINVGSDILYLKPEKSILLSNSEKLYNFPLFYLFYVIPAGIFAISIMYRRKQDKLDNNRGLKRRVNAWKKAQKRIEEATGLYNKGQKEAFCGKLHETINCYIGDMQNLDTGGITSRELEKSLSGDGIEPGFAEHIRKTLEMFDFVRFASSNTSEDIHNKILQDTNQILVRLKETYEKHL